jgi:bla regulator protein BlaR1
MESVSVLLQPFWAWLARSTLQASILICLILLVQLLLRHKLGSRWCHALWLVLLLRMVLPWAPQSRASIFNLIPRSDSPVGWHLPHRLPNGELKPALHTSVSTGDIPAPAGASSEPTPHRLSGSQDPHFLSVGRQLTRSIGAGLPLIWLAGVLVLGIYICVSSFALLRIVRRERPLTDQKILDLVEDCKAEMGIRTVLGVVATDKVRSACLFGFVRPRLLLPKGMIEALNREKLRYVFLHELGHLKRHDIWLGWLTSILQALHWFNPLVWLAFYRMRADRELACDALVLARLTSGGLARTQPDESKNYGRTIVSLIERFSKARRLPAMAGILETKSELKRRITMIAQFKNNSYRWSVAGVGLITVLGTISMIDPTRGAAPSGPATPAKPSVTMRLVESPGALYVSLSPDGRYLVKGKRGGFVIRELATGEERIIKPTKEAPKESEPEYLVMSPDNKTIVYWVGRPEERVGDLFPVDLRLIGADGSGQRVLCRGAVSRDRIVRPGPRPVQWFPDGKRLLGLQWPDPIHAFKEIEIVSVSIADGSIHVIKKLTGSFFNAVIRLSPDGKYVAYDVPSKEDPAKRDIFAVEIDSQRETLLVGHPADDRLLDWTPDRRHLLFLSDRAGSWGAWLLPVAQGQARGTARVVAANIGNVEPLGFTGKGSYYYRLAYGSSSVYVAAINVTTGQVLSEPASLEAASHNAVGDWSPDGKYLAYCARPAATGMREPGVIRIRALATGEERELLHKIPVPFRFIRWSPDGRCLLISWLMPFQADKAVWSTRVGRIDVQTGDTTVLLETEDKRVGLAELSPDGKILYYDGGPIVRRQLDTGQEKEIFTYTQPFKGPGADWALSPDGQFIAVACNEGREKNPTVGGVKRVVLIPSEGGRATELVRWEEPAGRLVTITWSADSKTVLFTLQKEAAGGEDSQRIDEFWQVTRDGGQPKKITETAGMGFTVRVHPDGQRIAFSRTDGGRELWVMENFLPAGK